MKSSVGKSDMLTVMQYNIHKFAPENDEMS